MIKNLKKLDKIYDNLISQMSHISRCILYAGIWTSIICAVAGVLFMLYILVLNNASPTMYTIATYIIKTGAGTMLLGTILSVIIEFVNKGKSVE